MGPAFRSAGQVKNDRRDWTRSRVVWVADRGLTPADNRRYLRSGTSVTSSEKLRSGSAEAQAALSRQDRHRERHRDPAGQGGPHRAGVPPLANIDGTYTRVPQLIGVVGHVRG